MPRCVICSSPFVASMTAGRESCDCGHCLTLPALWDLAERDPDRLRAIQEQWARQVKAEHVRFERKARRQRQVTT